MQVTPTEPTGYGGRTSVQLDSINYKISRNHENKTFIRWFTPLHLHFTF